MPGRKWYVVAGIVFVVGVCAFGAMLFFGIRGLGRDFARFAAPGAIEIEVTEPGRWTIYRETGSLGGIVYETYDVSGIEVEVTAPDGTFVPLQAPSVSQSYNMPGRHGYSVFEFHAGAAGRYRIEASYPTGSGSPALFAVGRGFSMKLMVLILASVGTALATGLLSVGIAVVTFVRRYRAARRRTVVP